MPVAPDPHVDLRAARRHLIELGKFDDKGKPRLSKAEWRQEFLIATCDITDAECAALWADCLF
jgi:hypothetical protein